MKKYSVCGLFYSKQDDTYISKENHTYFDTLNEALKYYDKQKTVMIKNDGLTLSKLNQDDEYVIILGTYK